MITTLPDFDIEERGVVSRQFLHAGIKTYAAALRYVRNLPYGRISSAGAYWNVIRERKGTCSTKHALLVAVAHENAMTEIHLTVGIYAMNERNTPGIGVALERAGAPAIPEAHCYLRYRDNRFDYTMPGDTAPMMTLEILHEERIMPEQCAAYKRALHMRYLQSWIDSGKSAHISDVATAWRIREECIAALSDF